jgi:hypothetical protein
MDRMIQPSAHQAELTSGVKPQLPTGDKRMPYGILLKTPEEVTITDSDGRAITYPAAGLAAGVVHPICPTLVVFGTAGNVVGFY